MSALGASTASVGDGLVLEDVSVAYGDATIIDGLSLTVEPGELVAVVGPSGSGKSTLLRAVAGLEPLAGGSIRLAGRDLVGVPTHHRGLGLMFQDHGLFTHLDVVDNIGYGLRVAGHSDGARRARVEELVALVGLEGLERRRVDQLSGGEAQRVALARALAPEPGLLMLDEPLGSLDRALREQLTTDLRRLLSGLGQTALHVTHDQSEAFVIADRVAVIDEGRLAAIGRPAELWADPGSVFVAQFLGHPNRWSATVGDGGVVTVDEVDLGRIDAEHPCRSAGPGPVEVVLPVTAVSLGPSDAGPHPGSVAVIVEQAVFAGDAFDLFALL
ncbi:MAG: ABC transporter ATP-binding protein, partial [Actinomycetota bacterium]